MPKFNIISQFLKDISFESPNVPELFFKQDNGQAKLEINIDINIKGSENNLFMVDLITKVHSKLEKDDKTMFLIESTYTGIVQYEEKDEETKKKTLLIDVPFFAFVIVYNFAFFDSSSRRQISFKIFWYHIRNNVTANNAPMFTTTPKPI